MYSKVFWDNIYKKHYSDAPWMDDSWRTDVYLFFDELISPLMNNGVENFSLLDYGCGNGRMGLLFSKKGMAVDLADISSVLIEKLRQEYANETNMNIYETETPNDLPKGKKYNVIIVRNVFHHLNPQVWGLFLKGFSSRLKTNGLLFISGWDKEDDVIRQDNNIAKYTGHETWCINDLPDYINDLPFSIVKNEKLEIYVPEFKMNRKFRFFVLNKLNK